MITRNYPFYKGEPFVENEIGEINNHFDKVIVIAALTQNNPKQTRSVPKGVDIVSNTSPKYFGVFRYLSNTLFWKDIIYDIEKNKRILHHPIRVAKCAAFSYIPKKAFADIRKKIQQYNFNQYDEIIIYSYWLHYTAEIAIKLKEHISKYSECKVKVISRAHRYDIYEQEEKGKYIAFREHILSKVDKVYSISEDGRNYISRKYPNYSYKIHLSRLGVPNRGLNPSDQDSIIHIVSCSRIEKVKRIHLIIDILSEFKDRKIKWTHFGGGSQQKKIKEYAKKITGNINVDFKGSVSNSELMEYYKQNHIDIFINVSSSEGIPVSIMEAMSFGIPIIATNVGGTGEIIDEGVNGHLLNRNFDVKFAVEKIYNLIDRESKYSFRNSSRLHWEKNYNSDINYRKFVQELKQI
ncbi:glycosyltransferase [Alkalicoccobacillus murimartini]|uniref:Glycosyltransferase involved in cell wall biosynthesis n=1 Tax=Alkalicoccobacillus murimartini TaxID=171685 RepID=A0ABT9YGK0_9BACI|nr:glycosyltransferase [Alkalicoccobacillus murimartini]MDQ0206991.1 glycosyltransferase involved in cell wall biosynthesis [Alkalicoccobacillus murimartini]